MNKNSEQENELVYEELKATKEQIEEQEEDNIIELRNQMSDLLEERFPIKQQYDEVNHKIELLKLRIQNANSKYFQSKGL